MSDPTPEQSQLAARERFDKFVVKMERWAAAAEKHAKAVADLNGAIDDPQDGLITVMFGLIEEMRGLREDIRIFAKAGGMGVNFSLFGTAKPRRRT